MLITCWGTRGSLPRASTSGDWLARLQQLAELARSQGVSDLCQFMDRLRGDSLAGPAPDVLTHGGETMCTEIVHGPTRLYLDMGSGLRNAGEAAAARGDTESHVLLSHLHWDHLMGLPLFAPLHDPAHTLHLYHLHPDAPAHVRLLFNGVNFPLTWDQVRAAVVFHPLTLHEPRAFGELRVTPYQLDHPGGAYGFRVCARDEGRGEAGREGGVAVAVDTEAVRRTAQELGADAGLYRGAELLLVDGQYTPAQLEDRTGWGHASPQRGLELARRFGVRHVRFVHHDPGADDATLEAMLADVRAEVGTGADEPHLAMAWDGLRMEL